MDIHEEDAVVEPEVDEDLEAPEADAVEQHQPVRPEDADHSLDRVPFDVDEYDAAEQSRVVELDEDDYR